MKQNRGFMGVSALVVSGVALLAILGGGAYALKGSDMGKKWRGGDAKGEIMIDDYVPMQHDLEQFPIETLSAAEQAGLIMMREEEKLAHDVYLALYDVWGQKTFNNIASSEQRHTNAVHALLQRYDVADPVVDDARGEFTDPAFSELYSALVAQGSESLVAALTVGATVEDLDIKDLQDLLSETDNADIAHVYENLMRGSRNHLRSFVRQLERNGATYEAQYLTQSQVDEVLAGEQERGEHSNGGGTGQGKQQGGQGMHGGQGSGNGRW